MGEGDRIRWQCRRGLLELDLVLGRFLDRHYGSLDAAGRSALETLLTFEDNDLWELVTGRREPEDAALLPVVRLMRES